MLLCGYATFVNCCGEKIAMDNLYISTHPRDLGGGGSSLPLVQHCLYASPHTQHTQNGLKTENWNRKRNRKCVVLPVYTVMKMKIRGIGIESGIFVFLREKKR